MEKRTSMGLTTGVVTKVDPQKNGEHQIKLSIGREKVTARLATLDAGSDRGSFFLPEVGDEVIVGFLNDDPKKAVILGMVHNKKRPVPIAATPDNHVKGFTTRSKMHIQFDDEKKSITIDTPSGNKIVLNEDQESILIQDQHGSKVQLSGSGIELISPKDIKMEAGGKIEIKAEQALKINGVSIALDAETSFEAKGATAKLEAAGIAQVNGALVKIN
jgi:uncharacterized protein involved in type VI secretion and phage assembly